MAKRSILIVAVDGLRASALGAYGNTTFPTPALDRFAANSFLLDACFAPATDLDAVYRALWQSQYPLRPAPKSEAETLPKILAAGGWTTTLITDDPAIANLAGDADFEHHLQVTTGTEDAMERRALDTSQTAMAQLFAASCDAIQPNADAIGPLRALAEDTRPQLIWVHSRGLYGPWDAPLELQQRLLDEGDPAPVEAIRPPDLWLSDADDPDAAFRYSCAYAAQIMTLDSCWPALLEATEAASGHQEWLVALIGLRGFPLGEHRRIGGVDDRTYGEQAHVPWLIRFPDSLGRLARSGALAWHADFLPTILEWLAIERPQESDFFDGSSILPLAANPRAPWRGAVLMISATSRAIRTQEWCLRQDAPITARGAQTIASELFVRPDDRWEANDVAKLCPEVVESLNQQADDLSRQLREQNETAN